ncbi:MAG: hypothetical protein KBD76_03280 [Bacteriovorax sp.]|nr:hypothetical protein [Bacteriovorax sp.]
MKFFRNDQMGQTGVEYILMLLVMVTIISSLLITIKTKYLGDMTKCDKAPNKGTLLCRISAIFDSQQDKRFQYFPFKK